MNMSIAKSYQAIERRFDKKSLNILFGCIICMFLLFHANESYAAKPDSNFSLKGLDYWYTFITNPVESITYQSKSYDGRTAIEEQHTIPQSHNGSDSYVVYWARSNHTVSDRWRDRPALVDWPSNVILRVVTLNHQNARENLSRAFLMGTYGIKYSVFFHDYASDNHPRLVSLTLDGVSNLLYGVTWLINTPQKFANRIAYIIDGNEPTYWYLVDVVIGLFVFAFEVVVATVFTVIGVIFGTILHPITTIFALIGGIFMFLVSAFMAVWKLLVGIILVVWFVGKAIIMLPIRLIR